MIKRLNYTFSKNTTSSIEDALLFCPADVSEIFEDRTVGDIDWTLLVSVKRFFLVAVVAGDLDVEAARLFGITFVLVDALVDVVVVVVRFGDGGRVISSFVVADVNTVNEGVDDNMAKDDNGDEFELLFIVKNDDDVDVVVIDDETGLLIIKRGVGFVTIGFVGVDAVVVVDIELVWVENMGGVELPDDDRMSEMEFVRS